jgi:cytochrome c oxidase subunit IV
MKTLWTVLLPATAGNTIHCMKLPVYVFTVLAVISTVRSCIHLLAPDGGSIAGMDLTVAGSNNIVFAFALWESAQLIYALIQLKPLHSATARSFHVYPAHS